MRMGDISKQKKNYKHFICYCFVLRVELVKREIPAFIADHLSEKQQNDRGL